MVRDLFVTVGELWQWATTRAGDRVPVKNWSNGSAA